MQVELSGFLSYKNEIGKKILRVTVHPTSVELGRAPLAMRLLVIKLGNRLNDLLMIYM